ncbi:MAG TPA: hypothetical protein VK422_03075, partial [Pyrinomonadaceae bacterium]|nr:hypothetical protein [Pyrinomonadaceae bacterium]
MAERYIFDSEEEKGGEGQPLERELRERLRSVRSASERRTIAGLAREIGKLPADAARAALEVSAALAGLSLRAGVDFLKVVPEAARVLDAEGLRAWGEFGRRLTMADVETGALFFSTAAGELRGVPPEARGLLFQVCTRQLTLSTSVALETYRRAPEVARAVGDAALLGHVFEVALEIARRSARHSADFLAATPRVAASLNAYWQTSEDDGAADEDLTAEAIALAGAFAARAGGIAADMWAATPEALEALGAAEARLLFRQAALFLDRGGAAALHVLAAGG